MPQSHCCTGNNEDQCHFSFQIPVHFSHRTEEAIASGLLTKCVRTEIIQSISSLMMVHTTMTPEPIHYNTVCQKLVEQYPTLKDKIGSSGVIYVYVYISYASSNQ